VNDSNSDGGNFSEFSDSGMCKVNSPFSSNEEEEVVQPEPDRGRKNTQGWRAWGFGRDANNSP